MTSRIACRYPCWGVITTPSRAVAIAGSKSVAHGTRPYARCALSSPATTPGVATEETPIPIASISLIGSARPAPGIETKKSRRREWPSFARWTSRKPPPPGPVSVLSATQETKAAPRQASTALPPSARMRAPASAVSGCPAAMAPLTARRSALEERGRLEWVVGLRRRLLRARRERSRSAPLSHAGHDHRHPDLPFESLVHGRAEDDVRVVRRRGPG